MASTALQDATVPLLSPQEQHTSNSDSSGSALLEQQQQDSQQQQQQQLVTESDDITQNASNGFIGLDAAVPAAKTRTAEAASTAFAPSSLGLHRSVASSGGVGGIYYTHLGSNDNDNGLYNSSTTVANHGTRCTILWIGLAILFTFNTLWSRHVYSNNKFDSNEFLLAAELTTLCACIVIELLEHRFLSRHSDETHGFAATTNEQIPVIVASVTATSATARTDDPLSILLDSWLPHVWDTLRMSLPPLLSWLQNSWMRAAIMSTSIAPVMLEMHTRLLVVAVLSSTACCCLLRCPIRWTSYQWRCLFLITLCEELEVFSDVRGMFWMTSDGVAGWMSGTIVMLLATIAGATGLVYTERVLKESPPPLLALFPRESLNDFASHVNHDVPDTSTFSQQRQRTRIQPTKSIWRRGAQQAFFSALIWASLVVYAKQDAKQYPNRDYDHLPLFFGFTKSIWMLVLAQVPVYLWSLMVLYHTDSVYKTMAGSLSYLLSDVVYIAILGTNKLTFLFVIGAAVTLPAMYAFHRSRHHSTIPTTGTAIAAATATTEQNQGNDGTTTNAVELGRLLPLTDVAATTNDRGCHNVESAALVGKASDDDNGDREVNHLL